MPDTHTAEKLLHELQVHQAELEMQNKTLRQLQITLKESRDRYVNLYDFAPVGYITLTTTALITEINLTAAALLRETRNKLYQRRFASFVSAESADQWCRIFHNICKQGGQQSCEIVLQRADGSRFDAQLDFLPLECTHTTPMIRIALNDISARKRAEAELRIAACAFNTCEGIMVTDVNGIILRVNNAFTRMLGYSAEEAIGKTPALLKSGRHDRLFYEHMWQALQRDKHWQGEIWNRSKNGKIYAEWMTISAVLSPTGHTTHYVGTLSDITQNNEAEAEIHRLAYYDPLTQLPNRRLLQDRLGQALAATACNCRSGAVLFLDLDNFKTVNDICGHDAVYQILVELAQRLHSCVRACDTVAHLGGDEFVILLENLSGIPEQAAAQSKQLADKVQEIIAVPFTLNGEEYSCSTSIGISLFHENTTPAEKLLKHADLALYQSKHEGRNT